MAFLKHCIFLYQTGSEVLELSGHMQTNQYNCSGRSFSMWRNRAQRVAAKPHLQKWIFFFLYARESISPFLSSPFFHFWQVLRRFLDQGTRCYLSTPSFIPSFVFLCQTVEISASSRYIMRAKNSCSVTVSHFQHTTTPCKLEDSPVIFYLLVYNSRWRITHTFSLPSRIKRSAYSFKRDRDLKQRKSLAYLR